MCGDLDLSGWPLYHCITAPLPPPSSLLPQPHPCCSEICTPIKRYCCLWCAGQTKQHSAEFAYLSAFSNVKAVWNKLSEEYPENLLLDRQMHSVPPGFLLYRRLPFPPLQSHHILTAVYSFLFFPLFHHFSVSVNPYRLDFTLQPLWSHRG